LNFALFAPVTVGATSIYSFHGKRRTASGFGELNVPLIGDRDVGSLTATGAIRYDHSNDFGGATTYQGGLVWRPTASLTLRGAYSTAYRAPPLANIGADVTIYPNTPITDPKRNNDLVFVTASIGGNPNLGPERGRSITAGFVWSPDDSPFKPILSINFWSVEQRDRVTYLDPQTVVEFEQFFPNSVTRAAGTGSAVGPITAVSAGYINFGKLNVSGFDAQGSLAIPVGQGSLRPSFALVYTAHYRGVIAPGAPALNGAGQYQSLGFAPRLKGNVGLEYSDSKFSLGALARYTSFYKDASPTRRLGDFAYLDLNAGVNLSSVLDVHRLRALKVSLISNNVFNKLPPYSSSGGSRPGYDPTQYDILGRTLFLRLDTSF
jgi:outer membrane receptor protein involved in Fe transport